MSEKTMKKVELLAPAGEMQGAIGAIDAGADAVYLGAADFSARAYAKNLTVEEIISVIRYAHLYQRKIYLAMNTLVKTPELSKAFYILEQLYTAGLDAVIVQDLGLLECLHRYFPELEIHASTQMAVLSRAGMEWLKPYHVTRVVPGRELSLKELIKLKESGLELECFIHGAMCYSYSGRCLLSSLAGGRSGNRGRCAGPCRKQYRRPGQNPAYLLSMKDMCSVDRIEDLMRAGIDSLKIEGRMKAPEYTAGVTLVYRRVIDRIRKGEKYPVTEEDREILRELYIRSEIQEGYLFRHNAKQMISLSTPSYSGCSDIRKRMIQEEYLSGSRRYPIGAVITVKQDEPLSLTLIFNGLQITSYGDTVQKAQKRALTDEEIRRQICKTGNTYFKIAELEIQNDGLSFAAVSQLKELRRNAIELLENKIFTAEREYKGQRALAEVSSTERDTALYDTAADFKTSVIIGVKTKEQLGIILKYNYYDGIIIPLEMITEKFIKSIYAHNEDDRNITWYIRLPEIIREKDRISIESHLRDAAAVMGERNIGGIYCGSLDALMIAENIADGLKRIADMGIYVMNDKSENMILRRASAYTFSAELNKKEIGHAIRKDAGELIVYGYLPVMFSANCIINTTEGCNKKSDETVIVDENGRNFHVFMNHDYCYNTIYNCVPLSLHENLHEMYLKAGISAFRLEFTIEDQEKTDLVMGLYRKALARNLHKNTGENMDFSLKDYTKGHFNRGVE